jgi:hypothetical protein
LNTFDLVQETLRAITNSMATFSTFTIYVLLNLSIFFKSNYTYKQTPSRSLVARSPLPLGIVLKIKIWMSTSH